MGLSDLVPDGSMENYDAIYITFTTLSSVIALVIGIWYKIRTPPEVRHSPSHNDSLFILFTAFGWLLFVSV